MCQMGALRHVCRRLCSHRSYRESSGCHITHRCKLLVVGGGTGGCSVAWRMSQRLKYGDILVLEPAAYHYYQPMFTLVAAGLNQLCDSRRLMSRVLPPTARCLRDFAAHFDPENGVVYTRCGDAVCYEYMVVAMGLQNDYDQVAGLRQALENPHSGVSTIYSPEYCTKTWCSLKAHRGGHALFTFPTQAGKCSGAAQKIMYLADDYWRKHGVRDLTNITYNTGKESLFGVPKYCTALSKVASSRGIAVNCCTELVEVAGKNAVFNVKGEMLTLPFNVLHVTPPMSPPLSLRTSSELVTPAGYLDVDKYTLRHRKYENVYGVGDCTSTPNSKTAAAAGVQSYVVERNLLAAMSGKDPVTKYDGYGACPILTSYRKGILAESVYDKKPRETFPFDQSKERRLFFRLKKSIFPRLYWNKLIKGKWDGPLKLRRLINPTGR